MRKLLTCLLLCSVLLAAVPGCAEESYYGAYLDPEALQELQPAYESFLRATAEILVSRGLLESWAVEDWVYYQLGDYLQNGGYGTFWISYVPGLLSLADESVSIQRFRCATSAGTLQLTTLRKFSVTLSSLPGVPLDAELLDDSGYPVPCRFRYVAPCGSLLVWNGTTESVDNVGATYINQDQALYWYEEPAEGISETIRLEILSATEDQVLASLVISLESARDSWRPKTLEVQK